MSRHVGQFESLRGIAAGWVFVSHAMAIAEVDAWPLSDGGAAVDVFIMLSGFVITLLINRRPEPYGGYLFRRWARLYPLYLIALALGWATQGFAQGAFAPVLFGGTADPGWYAVVKGTAIVPNLLLHLTMLHGVVPDAVLPNAVTAFSGPLWSLSLEWQFYLVAPLFVRLLDIRKRGRWPVVGVALLGIAALQLAAGHVWHAAVPAFLPLRLLVFAVGILSGHGWDRAREAPLWRVAALWAAWLLLQAALHRHPAACVPYLPWVAVYLVAAGHGRRRWLDLPNRLLLSPGLRWLGERSYGLYVLHLPILLVIAALWVVPHARQLGQPLTLAALLAVFPVVLVPAALIYRAIERPVIDWARKVEVRRLWRRRPRHASA